MDNQQDLRDILRRIIACELECNRKTRQRVLGRLESACSEARERGDLDFFLDLRKVVDLPSGDWRGWLRVANFRTQVDKIIRRHGLSVFMVALLQLESVMGTRQPAQPPALDGSRRSVVDV